MEEHTIAVDDLLAHSGWVRALARSLVSNPQDAEDLVQETWLAALRRPPSRSDARAWLARVVRNAAGQRRRRDAARTAREREPRDRDVPTPDAVAERLDAQRALAEELVALDEPLRRTLYLRYYEGLEPTEIARLTDTPAGTVRWRLKRGLDELRGRLDARSGGRRAWMAVLAPWARPSGTAAAGAPAGSVAKIAAVLAGAAVLGVGWRVLASDDPAPAGPGAAVAATPAPAVVDPSGERPARVPAAAVAPPARGGETQAGSTGEPSARFRLEAVDPDGHPVPGAEVRRANALAGLLVGPPLGVTGADGRVAVDVAAGDAPVRVELTVVAAGFEERDHGLELRAGDDLDAGTVRLAPGAVATGRVLDEDGSPIAGAWIDWQPARHPAGDVARRWRSTRPHGRARTDDLGRYRLPGMPAGDVRLWAVADRAVATPLEPRAFQPGERRDDVDFVLPAWPLAETVAGRVVDPDGAPVPGAVVRLAGGASSSEVVTGDGGTFALLVDSDDAYVARALPPASADWGEPVVEGVAGGHARLELVFQPPRRTRLVVTGAGGEPPEAWQVTVRPRDPGGTTRTLAGNGGEPFDLALPLETCTVEVRADGLGACRLGPFPPGPVPARLECVLSDRRGLRGRVVDTAGEPVADAVVTLKRAARGRVLYRGFPVRVEPRVVGTARTDRDGRYRLDAEPTDRFGTPLRPGGTRTFAGFGEPPPEALFSFDYVVFAEAPGLARSASEPVSKERADDAAGVELDDLVLGPGGSIAGRVVAPAGVDLAGRVVGASRGDSFVHEHRLDADGRFRFDDLAPGPWLVHLVEGADTGWSASGGETWPELPATVRVEAGATAAVELDRTDAGRAIVRVSIAMDGEPPNRAELRLQPAWFGPTPASHPWVEEVVAVRDPSATVRGEPGRVWLRAAVTAGDGPPFVLTEPLELAPGPHALHYEWETGSVQVVGVRRLGFPVLAWDDGSAAALWRLRPDGTDAVLLPRVPAGRLRAVRSPTGPVTDDPRDWETIAAVEVVAGRLAVLDLR